MDYFIADTHFFHGNIIKYTNRPVLNEEEQLKLGSGERFKVSEQSINRMNDLLIDRINSVVDSSDRLYHVGDFLYGIYDPKQIYEKAVEILRKINCEEIHLIRGNHDHPVIEPLFASVKEQHTLKINNEFLHMNHWAMAIWPESNKGSFHIYGHSHAAAEKWLDECMPNRSSMDVGVDNLIKVFGSYTPVTFKQIKTFIRNKQKV